MQSRLSGTAGSLQTSERVISSFGAKEVAQLLKCVLWKPKDLSLIPSIHLEGQVWWCIAVIPGLGRWRQVDPGDLSANASAQVPWETLFQHTEWVACE